MTLTKRIVPCLDVANGRVVKGLHFESIKDAGDPVLLAEKYSGEGADELVFLDITASTEQRETIKSLVAKVADVSNPFWRPSWPHFCWILVRFSIIFCCFLKFFEDKMLM